MFATGSPEMSEDWTPEEIERWEAEGGASKEKQKGTNIVPFRPLPTPPAEAYELSPEELNRMSPDARAKALSDHAVALRAWWDETGGLDAPVF